MFVISGHIAPTKSDAAKDAANDAANSTEPLTYPMMTAALEVVDDKLRIDLFEPEGQAPVQSHTLVLNPALVTQQPDICAGYIGRDVGIQLVWDSERFNTRDAASSVADRKSVPDVADSKFMAGFVGGDCYVVVCAPLREAPRNVQFAELPHTNTPRDWIASQHPLLKSLVQRNRAKRKALAHLNPMDSIAALEQQLDMLSQVVFTLVQGQPLPPWAAALAESIKRHSSVRDDAQGLASIATHKARVRALQATYFTERGSTHG
jgi:hypothetical protein